MPARYRLNEVKGAISRSAAGRVAATVPAANAPAAVSEDLAVLANQAAQYEAGAAAGAAEADMNLQGTVRGLQEDREQSDQAIQETLAAQREKAREIELARQAQREDALANIAKSRQGAELAVRSDNQRANLSVAAQAEERRQAETRRAQAQAEKLAEAEQEKIDHYRAGIIQQVARQHGKPHNEVFQGIANIANNFGEAREVINTMARDGAFSKGGVANTVRMDIIMKDLRKLYGS